MCGDGAFAGQRQADFVEPFDQAALAKRIDVEREAILEWRGHALAFQIDRYDG